MTTEKVRPSKNASSFTPKLRIGDLFERLAVPLLLVIFVIWFSMSTQIGDLFTSPANVQNILANLAVTGLLALGMVIPLVAGYFDLSVPAVAGVANVMTAALISTHGAPVAVAIIASLVVGLLVGAVNGFLVAILKLSPFITTLGTYILLGGLLEFYTKGQTISGLPASLGAWGSGKFLGVATPFWLLLIVAVVLWFVLMQTPFGRRLAAIGSNQQAAQLAGIRVDRAIFLTYLIAGFLGGLAGVLLTIRNGGGDATSAISYLFPAFAAMFLGQTAINPGRPNVWGTVFAVGLIAVAINGFTFLGASGWVSQVFNGTALVVAVAVSTLTVQARDRRARAAQFEAMRT